MPRALPAAETAAVVTMELQRGVVGDRSSMPALVDAAAGRETLVRCGALVRAARASDVTVVHAQVAWRADRRGTPLNSPMVAMLARNPEQMLEGTEAVEPLPELGDTSDDLVSIRRHGLTPFSGTDLDALLRSVGATTVVACGVSLNVGVLGLCLGAVDLGYRVVVPTDAVVGVPEQYGDEVIEHTLRPLVTLTTVDELAAAWS